jgi:hypothetical protein
MHDLTHHVGSSEVDADEYADLTKEYGFQHERITLPSITEVADILRARVAALRYWRHLATGPHKFGIGRCVRYWHHDVTTWLQQQSSEGDQPDPGPGGEPASGRAGQPGWATFWNCTSRGSGHPKTPRNGPSQGGVHNVRGNVA